MAKNLPLSFVEESILVAAFYRGGRPSGDRGWTSNSDQVVTLSLYYTGDISSVDCAQRFSRKSYVGCLYEKNGKLANLIKSRYRALIDLLKKRSELIEGGGDFRRPADPTYSACRLSVAGEELARSLISAFPPKPAFPNWPGERD